MSDELSIEIDKNTYAKLKKLAEINDCSVNEEVGNAFSAAYEDLDDSVFDEIAIMEKRNSVLLILPADLYDSFQEEADNNSTSIEDELDIFFEEHLTASGEEFEDNSSEYENEEESEDEGNEEESEESSDDSTEESNEDEAEEDEAQSIVIDKETYIKLKKLADTNECSINEEIGKAFSVAYEDMDEETLEKIDVMPRKDMVYVLLPKDLYDSFQEEADKNSTEIEEELKVFFEEHLSASGEEESEVEDDSIEEDVSEGDEDETDEEEYEEESSRAKKPKESKGFFGALASAVEGFVEELIGDEEEHKKKKNED